MIASRIGISERKRKGGGREKGGRESGDDCFQLMGGQVDDEEYLRVSEIAEKGVRDRAKKRGGK